MRRETISRWGFLVAVWVGLIVLGGGAQSACGAEVRLKNGNLFKGEITFENDTMLILDLGGGAQTTFQKVDIQEIIRKERFGDAGKDGATRKESEGKKGSSEDNSEKKPSAKKAKSEESTSEEKPATAKKEKEKEKEKGKERPDKDAAKEKAEAERKAKDEAAQKAKDEAEKEDATWGLKSLDVEKDQIDAYQPGNPGAYEWKALADAIPAIKTGEKPALLYLYLPGDKKSAYYYEKKLFPNPKHEGLDKDFLLVKLSAGEEAKVDEMKAALKPVAGKAGVAIVGKDLTIAKGAFLVGKLPKPEEFARFIHEAKATFASEAYKPGSIAVFTWAACAQGFEQMKSAKKPGLLYLFCGEPKAAKDKIAAYLIEKTVLSDPRFANLNERFVTMKADWGKETLEDLPKNAQKQTAIVLWTSDKAKNWVWGGKPAGLTPDDFAKLLDEVTNENGLAQFQPGADSSFSWLEIGPGIEKLKTGQQPALIYAYSDEDKKGANCWETEIFKDPSLKDLPTRFLMVKGKIADLEKVEDLKLKKARKPASVVIVVGTDLKVLQTLSAPITPDKFKTALERAEAGAKKPEDEKAAPAGERPKGKAKERGKGKDTDKSKDKE